MIPTLILYNGNFYTQDEARPHVSAIAIDGNRIVATGEDGTIRAMAGVGTEQIDLNGMFAMPGLQDAHMHLFNWAVSARQVNLSGCRSLAELQARGRARAAGTAAGEWLIGAGWVETEWSPPIMPTAADLDAISTQHPIAFWRTDMHGAIVNSVALERAGITDDTPNPDGGVIERDASGRATGRLFETAIWQVRQYVAYPSGAEADELIRRAIFRLHHYGLTGVHDQRMKGHGEGAIALRSYERLNAKGELKLRLTTNIDSVEREHAFRLGLTSGFGDDRLQLGFLKIFTDGSLGSQTAWMLEPFEGTTDNYGVTVTPIEEIAAIVREAQAHGWAVSIHAIGDRANRELLDIFEEVQGEGQATARLPHRIEHVQVIHPDDLPRLARLGVAASVQPIHATDDYIAVDRLWGARGANAYNFRSLLDLGTLVAFGSDCPVADPNPFAGIHAAVTRQRRDGSPNGGWYPDERVTVAQAIYAYTLGAHEVVGRDKILGRLAPGYLADITVVDRDLFAIAAEEIVETQVEMVVFDGEVIRPQTL